MAKADKNINDIYSGITVDTIKAYKILKLCVATESTAMLWGSPGIGKTTMVYDLAEELDMPCCVFNPSQDDIIDFKLPYVDEDPRYKDEHGKPERISRFAYSERLPRNKPAIVLVDEINTANMATQATLYSFVLEGRIGSYKVPPGTIRFAAGNREHDKCAANPMSVALKDRLMLHMNVVPSMKGFCQYGATKGFAPEILAFIRVAPQNLDKVNSEDPTGGCTPRSLEALSRQIKYGVDRDIELNIINGTIGRGVGQEFKAFLDLYRASVHIEDIIKNPTKSKIPDKPDILYSIVSGLGYVGNESNIESIAKYLSRLDNPSYASIAYDDMVRKNQNMLKCKPIIAFMLKHHNAIAQDVS